MKRLSLVLAILIASISYSQSKDFQITGTIISEEETPLESATVYLERVKDSALVTYTITDKNGKFSLENSTSDKVLKIWIA